MFTSFRGGYIGPDYYTHFARLTEWPQIFDFSATSPPTYYLIGHGFFLLIGSNNTFPITLSIAQAAINTLAMWWFFLYTERCFKSPLSHLALVFFLTFLPVRIIHATTIGTDSTTIPLFVLLLFLFDRFLSDKSSTLKKAGLLGLTLAVAVCTKVQLYGSYFCYFPRSYRHLGRTRWRLKRFMAICSLTLILPSALALHSFCEQPCAWLQHRKALVSER